MLDVASLLDCPIWSSLGSGHASMAIGGSLARRYPKALAAFGGVAENTPRAFAELAETTAAGEMVVIFGGDDPIKSSYWEMLRKRQLVQMVCENPSLETLNGKLADMPAISKLTSDDVPDMLALVKRTEPGPFFERTIELGSYYGIWQDGQLAAMAGERFNPTGYREISAVCTHPSFQRRGHAKRLITRLVNENFEAGNTPFLHTGSGNANAIGLYESLGFTIRSPMPLYVLKRVPSETGKITAMTH